MCGHSFFNISGMTMANCLEHCLANCLCLSFQICGNTSECQLCFSNKYLNPHAMRQFEGCTSYNFRNKDKVEVKLQRLVELYIHVSVFNAWICEAYRSEFLYFFGSISELRNIISSRRLTDNMFKGKQVPAICKTKIQHLYIVMHGYEYLQTREYCTLEA